MRSLAVETRLDTDKTLRSLMHGLRRGSGWKWLVVLAFFILLPFGAQAQIGGTGTIQGTVTDPAGAVIPGAAVTATDMSTGVKITRTTDKDGYYVLSPLNPDNYSVTVSATGFEKLVREKIHIDGMQVLGLNLTLQIGAASVTMTVTDTPPALETENATLGSVMENHVYESLPLEMGSAGHADQRRATDFAALMPGVTANETKNDETDEPMVVNGNANSSELYIEGVPATALGVSGDPRFMWSAFSVESVNQFQLKTSAYSAEYRGLGISNYTVKAGGNKYHGSAYDVIRNTAFDAAGFIPAQNVVTGAWYTPPEHMNEYGISLGGPVWRNKIFLFANYMGYRYSTVTTPQYQTIPTTKMRGGDFSELLSQTTPITIYDPTTQTCVSTTNCSRPAFTGNIIPTTEVSPIAKAMSALLPTPSNGNIAGNYLASYPWGLNNWSTTERLDVDLSQKHNLSVIIAAGRQGLIGNAGSQTTNGAPLPYMYAKIYAPITKDGIFEDTYVINNSLVNQFKYGAMQYYSPAINPTLGNSAWSASGFDILGLPAGQTQESFPDVKWDSSDEQKQWGPQASAGNVTNSFTLLDNLQWVRGKHSFSFGGQIQWLEYNYESDKTGTSPLTLTADLAETEGFSGNDTVTAAKNTGFDYASFMVGAMHAGTYTEFAPSALETGMRTHPYAFYVNDDYKATSKLTINAGLRWDVLPPTNEAENRMSFLNPTGSNPYTGKADGTLEFAGNGTNSCHCSTPASTYYKNWGPRLGLAYAVDSKTVVRASFGMYYTIGGGTGGNQNSSQPGSALELGYSAAPSPSSPGLALPAFYLNGNPGVVADNITIGTNTYSNDPTNTTFGGTGYSVTAPPIYDAGYATYYSTALNSSNPDYISSTLGYIDPKLTGRAPEFTAWSFGFQRSITRNMTATVSYVGNEGHHLTANYGASAERGYYNDALDPKWLALGACLGQTPTGSASTKAGSCASSGATVMANNGISLPYSSFPTSQKFSQMLLPFPQYKGVTDEFGSVSNSNYNSLQTTLEQRLSNGLTFMFNYTFSKSIDNAGTFRAGYAIPAIASSDGKAYAYGKADRSLSSFDQRHAINATATYDLPFGRGHIGGDNNLVRALAGGWRLSGIYTFIGGNPLQITQSTCSGNSVGGSSTCMPANAAGYTGNGRINGKWGKGDTRSNMTVSYIDPAAFATTGTGGSLTNPYVIGNSARSAPYNLRGPSNYNIDLSIRRTFDLWRADHVKLVLEASSFNLLNHVWFGTTSSNASGSINQVFGNSNFGQVTGQANNPRQFQFAGHVNF